MSERVSRLVMPTLSQIKALLMRLLLNLCKCPQRTERHCKRCLCEDGGETALPTVLSKK